LDERARVGAPCLRKAALEAEVRAYVAAPQAERDAQGRALVVRNDHGRGRRVVIGSGTLTVQAPLAEGGGGAAPPGLAWAIHGGRSGSAAGRSPTTITHLTAAWETADTAFHQRALRGRDEVYSWDDGVHVTIRLEDARLCPLGVMGAPADGTKAATAVEDGDRESTESWLIARRDLQRRGLTAPVVAVGDGALGCWNAVGEVGPETRAQRGWVHRRAHLLDTWPTRLQPNATRAWHEIMHAATRGDAEAGITAFTAEDQAKYPKAVASLTRDQEKLLTFFDVPAEPWIHVRTTNPVESPFSTVRLQRVTKGAGSRTKGVVMAYKR
jgi:transposase-like protein